MRNIFTLILLTATFGLAQIPNPGFEQWQSGNPVGWATDNFQGFYTPVTQTSDKHSGQYAIKVGVDNSFGQNIPGSVTTLFKLDTKPTSVSGYYKVQADSNHYSAGLVYIFDSNTSIIGAGAIEFLENAGNYTPFKMDITYYMEGQADSCYITFVTGSGDSIIANNWLILDDLTLESGTTDLPGESIPAFANSIELQQNYPNPFNPQTNIRFTVNKAAKLSLAIYDVTGRELDRLFDNRSFNAGDYSVLWNAGNMPSGVYFYKLSSGEKSYSGRMLLVK